MYLEYLNTRTKQTMKCYKEALCLIGRGSHGLVAGLVILMVSVLATPFIPITAAMHYAHKTGLRGIGQ